MRVYIPMTVPLLRSAVSADRIVPTGGTVFAVTGSLRAEYPGADEEELEYLAMADAGLASLRLLAAADPGPDDGPRALPSIRVVAAADVVEVVERGDLDRCAATVAGPVPWPAVAAVHVDGADAGPIVRAAVSAVDAADLGDLDADFAVGAAQDIDLAWYAPDEISYLLVDLDGSSGGWNAAGPRL